jgi:hypothetical protein
MPVCANCGTNNAEGTKFCVSCGGALASAPAPESWRASGDLGATPGATATDATGSAGGGYAPGASAGYTPPPPSSYPAYTPQQTPQGYPQQPVAQPMHPAVPAIISLFLPGIGLLLVPGKQGLGIGVFAGYIVLWVVAFLLTFIIIGACLFLLFPLLHIAAAIQSWDEAAKASGGQFQPILFK